MAKKVTDVNALKDYIKGVINRADHHAPNVDQIIFAVAGAIIWKKDDDPIEVRTYAGEMANVLRLKIDGNRYCLSYNHTAGTIELKKENIRGNVIYSFSNSTPLSEIRTAFEQL